MSKPGFAEDSDQVPSPLQAALTCVHGPPVCAAEQRAVSQGQGKGQLERPNPSPLPYTYIIPQLPPRVPPNATSADVCAAWPVKPEKHCSAIPQEIRSKTPRQKAATPAGHCRQHLGRASAPSQPPCAGGPCVHTPPQRPRRQAERGRQQLRASGVLAPAGAPTHPSAFRHTTTKMTMAAPWPYFASPSAAAPQATGLAVALELARADGSLGYGFAASAAAMAVAASPLLARKGAALSKAVAVAAVPAAALAYNGLPQRFTAHAISPPASKPAADAPVRTRPGTAASAGQGGGAAALCVGRDPGFAHLPPPCLWMLYGSSDCHLHLPHRCRCSRTSGPCGCSSSLKTCSKSWARSKPGGGGGRGDPHVCGLGRCPWWQGRLWNIGTAAGAAVVHAWYSGLRPCCPAPPHPPRPVPLPPPLAPTPPPRPVCVPAAQHADPVCNPLQQVHGGDSGA